MRSTIGKKLQDSRIEADRNEIVSFCKKFSQIYIYGTYDRGQAMLLYLLGEEIKCAGFIVSDKRRKNTFITLNEQI